MATPAVESGTGPAVVNRVDPATAALAHAETRRDPPTLDVDAHAPQEGDPQEAEKAKADEAKVKDLKARDAEVRSHEQAHAAVGGGHTGSPNYETEVGPDGRTYAVGGEVSVDVSVVAGDPKATLLKMQQVKRAALAPANPSSADRAVAAKASAQAAAASRQIDEERTAASEAATTAPVSTGDNRTEAASSTETPAATRRRAAQNAYAPPAAPSLGSMVNLQSCGKCGGAHGM